MARSEVTAPKNNPWPTGVTVEVEALAPLLNEISRYAVYANGQRIGDVSSHRYTTHRPDGRFRKEGAFQGATGWAACAPGERGRAGVHEGSRAQAIRTLLRNAR